MNSGVELGSETRKLSLTTRSIQQLSNLRVATEASSDSEVVRNALLNYEQLVDDIARNCEVLVRDRAGLDTEIASRPNPSPLADDDAQFVKRNLVLPKTAARRIDALIEATGAQSHSEVVRDAIDVFDRLVSAAQSGMAIIVRDPRSNREFYKTIAVPGARRPALGLTARLGRALAEAIS